jgi:hypothetical protein
MTVSNNPIPHSDSAGRGNCWCPLEPDCGLEHQEVSEFGEGVKEECGDGGIEELAKQVPQIFWSTDTSTFGIV